MDTKQFKKILKESLSTGTSSLFEEDEIDQKNEQETEQDNNSELVDYAQELLPYLEKTKQEIDSLESELKINPENFARAFAYYYVSLYYNNDSKWKYTIATPSRYKTLINILLDKVKTNIVCEYVNIIKLSKKEKMFENPTNFLKGLQSDASGKEVFLAIATVLNKIHIGNYDLDSSNSKKLQALIDKVGNFDPKKCKSMEAPSKTGVPEEEKQSTRTKKQQPMSLNSLERLIKSTAAKNYASQITTALKKDIKDLRVRMDEAREKTPLLKNTIKVLQYITDKKIQQIALKSVLDFFRKNNLQINNQTRFALAKSGISRRKNNIKRKPAEEKSKVSLPPLKYKAPEDGGEPYTIHRENLNLNERKYIMLLERLNIK